MSESAPPPESQPEVPDPAPSAEETTLSSLSSTDPGSTQHLVRQAREGPESPAWEKLSSKIDRFLRGRFGRRSLPPTFEVEDFVMEVMLRLLEDIKKYQVTRDGSFWSWLYRVAERFRIDLKRRAGAAKRGGGRLTFQEDDDARLDQMSDPNQTSPTQFARRSELAEVEMECVNRLSTQARDVYLMRRRDGMSFDEIASHDVGASADTLRSTFKRARDRVHQCIRGRMDALGDTWFGWRTE